MKLNFSWGKDWKYKTVNSYLYVNLNWNRFGLGLDTYLYYFDMFVFSFEFGPFRIDAGWDY